MGSLCSKPDTHTGGHTVLGSSASGSPNVGQRVAPIARSPQDEPAEERRRKLAEAAAQRQDQDRSRLVNKSNPNAGRLASQVNKPIKNVPQPKEPEPLRWD